MARPLLFFMFLVLVVLSYCVPGKGIRTQRLGAKNRLTPTMVNVESLEEYVVYNYTQTLDHFNYKSESYGTFQQRYVLIRKYWGGPTNNSPIFLYTGEETDIIGDVEYLGFQVTLAQRFNALLVFIESTSTSCYNTIRESWFEIDRVAAQPGGLWNLSQMFNTCMPLNTSNDLKNYLERRYKIMAQYDAPVWNYLPFFCNAIDCSGEKTYILDKIIAGFVAVDEEKCITIQYYGPKKAYGWDWQSCTEMVMPMGRGENDTMFQADPFDLEEYTKECQQVFDVTPRPYWIPIEFGGYGIKTVLKKFASNIIFSNGLRDPYSSGGVLRNISDTVVAVYTEEGHHCLDFNTPLDSDPDWLVAQRETVINIIQGWLSKYIAPNSLMS